MQVLDITTDRSKRKYREVHLYAMGDWHVGARGADLKHIARDIARVKSDPDAYVILMGDLVDAIAVADKRFDSRDLDPKFKTHMDRLPMAETEWVCDTLKPIKDKILCVLAGNHEERVRAETTRMGVQYDPHYEICRYLGTRTLSYCGFIRWRHTYAGKWHDGRGDSATYIIHATHGYGAGRQLGGHAVALDQMLDGYEADVLLMAHRHQLMAISKVRIGMAERGEPHLMDRTMVACHTGSYFKTSQEGHPSYAAQRGYKPVALGCVKITLKWTTARGRMIRAEVEV